MRLPDVGAFSNVLSRGPDATLDAALLGVVSAPVALADARLDAVSALVADVVAREPFALGAAAALPLFQSDSHAALLETLVVRAEISGSRLDCL